MTVDEFGLPVIFEPFRFTDIISPTLQEMGLERIAEDSNEWRRDQGHHMIALTSTGDGTWWLTVTGTKPEPAMEFVGNLGDCILQYALVTIAIQAGVWGCGR